MNITYVKKLNEVNFDTIQPGECFEFSANVFIKTRNTPGCSYNATNLCNGDIDYFYPNIQVVRLNVELIVHED